MNTELKNIVKKVADDLTTPNGVIPLDHVVAEVQQQTKRKGWEALPSAFEILMALSNSDGFGEQMMSDITVKALDQTDATVAVFSLIDKTLKEHIQRVTPNMGLPRMPIPHLENSPSLEVPKPPLGLRPRLFATENRLVEIRDAMDRYTKELHPIPQEWIEEYNELSTWLINYRNKHHG